MKRVTKLLVVAIAVTSMAFSASFAAAAEYELNFTTPYFERHPTVINVFKPWIKEVYEKTNKRLEITYFVPNTICPEPEIMDSVMQGTVDMGGNNFTRNAGRMAISDMGQVPLVNRYPRTTAMAWYDVVKKYPHLFPELQKDVTLLMTWASAPSHIITTKKPVRKLEDLKGMKIIGWNPVSVEVIRQLGAVPMLQSNADTYLALERGMADGMLAPIAPLRSQKLTDIARYYTMCYLTISPFWGGINTKTYEALPADIRKVLDETTGLEFSGIAGQSLEDGANADIEWIVKQGKSEIIELDKAELARWAKAVEPMVEINLKKIEAKGIKRAEAMDVFNYYRERIAHYNKIEGRE